MAIPAGDVAPDHIYDEGLLWECPYCGVTFIDKADWLDHLKEHEEEKPREQ